MSKLGTLISRSCSLQSSSLNKKILHYFDSHSITMVTSFPLGEVINNKDTIGHIAEWALELMQYDIAYVPHTTIKVT